MIVVSVEELESLIHSAIVKNIHLIAAMSVVDQAFLVIYVTVMVLNGMNVMFVEDLVNQKVG